jgi:hypothetical protein
MFFVTLCCAFVTVGWLIWIFETSIADHVSHILKFDNFQHLKDKMPPILSELFSCPWCLAFHISFWSHVVAYVTIFVNFELATLGLYVLSVFASAGIAMISYKHTFLD